MFRRLALPPLGKPPILFAVLVGGLLPIAIAVGVVLQVSYHMVRLPSVWGWSITWQAEQAAQVLEQSMRTNPSYTTAHENLGDVYAKLASQAYGKALQLDANNAAVPPKLALIRELFNPATSKGQRPASTLSTPAPVAPPPMAAPAKPAPEPVVSKPAAPAVPAANATPAQAAPAAAAPAAQPKAEPASGADATNTLACSLEHCPRV